MTASDVIKTLGLEPLEIEGGFFHETYRSPEVIPASALHAGYDSDRPFSTCIYYMLTADTVSRVHRLISDEVFHFYLGDPVEMLLLNPDGSGSTVTLGPDLMAGQRPQIVVPSGVWQGCRLAEGGDYALLGTTVAPGFEYADFEIGEYATLAAHYPAYSGIIQKLM